MKTSKTNLVVGIGLALVAVGAVVALLAGCWFVAPVSGLATVALLNIQDGSEEE